MQEIIKEYGPTLITVIAIVALVALTIALIGEDETSIVGQAFSGLITDFFEKASLNDLSAVTKSAGTTTVTP